MKLFRDLKNLSSFQSSYLFQKCLPFFWWLTKDLKNYHDFSLRYSWTNDLFTIRTNESCMVKIRKDSENGTSDVWKLNYKWLFCQIRESGHWPVIFHQSVLVKSMWMWPWRSITQNKRRMSKKVARSELV